jgi:hypothetical protein
MKLLPLLHGRSARPYPHTGKEKAHVVAVALVLLVIGGAGILAAQQYDTSKTLTPADVRQNASALYSMADGAVRTLAGEREGRVSGGFRRAHLGTLARQAKSKAEAMGRHSFDPAVKRQAESVVSYGSQLGELLTRASEATGSQEGAYERQVLDLREKLGRIRSEL